MGILPDKLFSGGGGERGQAMYSVTQNGKIAMDNDDLSGQERQIVEVIDVHNQLTVRGIMKETGLDRKSVESLVASMRSGHRKLLTKVN